MKKKVGLKVLINVFSLNLAEMDEELIDQRIEIRKMIERGNIEEAINKINSLNPEVTHNSFIYL